jgi:hypothetical protein
MVERERVLEITNIKERIIPAEESLLLDWSPILEKEAKGCILLYLQLQRAAYDEGGGKKAKIGMKKLSMLCANTAPTLNKCINILEKYKFISIERGKKTGISNTYSINPLPQAKSVSILEYKGEEFIFEDVSEGAKKVSIKMRSNEECGRVFNDKTVSRLLEEKAQSVIDKLFESEEWNCNDMLSYYKNYYSIAMKGLRTKEKFTNRERGEMKNWIEEYGWEVVQRTIKFSLDNWETLGYFNGYPSINALYGYRETLVPEMQRQIKKISKRGQHQSSGEKKEVGQW